MHKKKKNIFVNNIRLVVKELLGGVITKLLKLTKPNQTSFYFTCTVDSRYLEIEGTLKTVRDIRTSTYQICSIEEKTIWTTNFLQMTM